jgi:retron-type reverse transcriptase
VETSDKLGLQRFNFRPSRRVFIPKKNGKMRPLGFASPRDKIIQEAVRAVLEAILESKFLDSSHGFRPQRSCHTALATVRY